jgi:hypothetical protein
MPAPTGAIAVTPCHHEQPSQCRATVPGGCSQLAELATPRATEAGNTLERSSQRSQTRIPGESLQAPEWRFSLVKHGFLVDCATAYGPFAGKIGRGGWLRVDGWLLPRTSLVNKTGL